MEVRGSAEGALIGTGALFAVVLVLLLGAEASGALGSKTETVTSTTTVANTTVTTSIFLGTLTGLPQVVDAVLEGCSISRLMCTVLVYDGYPEGNVTIPQTDCLMLEFLIESTGGFACVSSPSSVLTYGAFATVNATLDRTSWNDGCITSCTPKVGVQISGSMDVTTEPGNNASSIPLTAGKFTP